MCCYAARSVLCTLHKADLAAAQLNVYRIAPHNGFSAAEQGQISQATRRWLCHNSPLWRNNWVNGTVSLLHPPPNAHSRLTLCCRWSGVLNPGYREAQGITWTGERGGQMRCGCLLMSQGKTGRKQQPEWLISDKNKFLHKQACCQPDLARYPTVWLWHTHTHTHRHRQTRAHIHTHMSCPCTQWPTASVHSCIARAQHSKQWRTYDLFNYHTNIVAGFPLKSGLWKKLQMD